MRACDNGWPILSVASLSQHIHHYEHLSFRFAIDVMQLSESMINSCVGCDGAKSMPAKGFISASESASTHWAQADVPVITDLTDVYSNFFFFILWAPVFLAASIDSDGVCKRHRLLIVRQFTLVLSQLTKLIKKITSRSHIEPMKINFFSWFIVGLFAINTAPCLLLIGPVRFNFQVKMIFFYYFMLVRS